MRLRHARGREVRSRMGSAAMTAFSGILDATVALADRLEESAASRVIGAYGDLIVAGVSAKNVVPSTAAGYALGCVGIAASLTLRLAARRLGRPSFSPLMAWRLYARLCTAWRLLVRLYVRRGVFSQPLA